ncbi:MAG: hypothetical protein GEV03_03950 [Streptosporangiales bacterium]|nr:hypothetical protein [Streptosporangiales bacterium]
MGNRRAAGWPPLAGTVRDDGRVGRWFSLMLAVPLAAGGTNSACEADYPPPGAEADQGTEDRGSHRGEDREKAEAAGDQDNKDNEDRGRNREIICMVSADVPTFDEEGSPFIVGEATYWCESPGADQLTVIVRVQQRNDDGTWVTVASSRDTAVGLQTVRDEGREERVRRATAPCRSGTYRTLVVAERGPGGDAKVLVDNSFQATDPCDP